MKRLLLGAILGLYLVLAVLYSVIIPPFEATDEISHFQYAQFLKENGRLPRQSHDRAKLENVVAHNPPLYYLGVLLASGAVDAGDLGRVAPPNPDFVWGDLNAGGPFVQRHDPVAERFPWQGAILALHLARLVSVGAGALTVLGAYRVGRRILRWDGGGLAVAALTAFLPSFLFTSATVHNDAFVTMFGVWALDRLMAAAEDGASLWDWAVIGLLIAGAGLSKVVGFLLLPLLAIPVVMAWRREGVGPALAGGALAAGLVAGLAVPWIGWNLANYGEPFGYVLFSTNPLFPIRDEALGLGRVVEDMGPRSLLFLTSLLAFGYMDRLGPAWLYDLGRLAVLLGLAGLLLRMALRPAEALRMLSRPTVLVAVVAVAIFTVSLGRYVQTFLSGGHGRYLFPVLPVLMAGLVAGWTGLLPRRAGHAAMAVASSLLAAVAIGTPFLVIAPGYALAGEVSATRAGALASVEPLAVFDGKIAVVEAMVSPSTVRPGERVQVRLVWRAIAPVERSYEVFVQVVGPAGGVGGVNGAPGGGLAATSRWTTGMMVEDRFEVPVAPNAPPGLYEVRTGFFSRASDERLVVTSGADRGGAAVIGRVKVPPPPVGSPETSLDLTYDGPLVLEGIGPLVGAMPGGALPVELYWRATGTPTTDYSLSLQLVSPGGVATQVDGPLGGSLPTSAWEAGERIVTRNTLAIPATITPGTYTLHAVVYRLADGGRLAAGGIDAPRIADVQVGRP
ncbi:MAG: glycosyltransferase family 39 protein [Dehalococcoidia bacterium]